MLRLSVITVTRDDPKGLRATLESVDQQLKNSLLELEQIVIDGSVKHSETIRKLCSQQYIKFLTHSPTGIYEAMNYGLTNSSGNYVHFLNSGDTYAAPDVLSRVVPELVKNEPLWAFGNLLINDSVRDGTGKTIVVNFEKEKRWHFSRGRFPPQPSTFYRRDAILGAGGFDSNYRFSADFDMALRLGQRSSPLHFRIPVANFSLGGVTSIEYRKAWLQYREVLFRYMNLTDKERVICEINLLWWAAQSFLSPRRRRAVKSKNAKNKK